MGAFLLPLALYVLTGYYDVTYWDVGEMDTVAWIFGIAHPPGFPLYVIIGWLFTHVLPVGSVAFRMTLLSALAMSTAAWCIGRMVVDATNDRRAGFASALIFALGLVVWTRATRAEVHAVETAFFSAMLLFALRWYRSHRFSDLLAAAALYGFAFAVHPVVLLAIPGLLVLFVARLHEEEPRRVLYALGVATLCALVWFAYLPLRSAFVTQHGLDPVASLGMPGGAFWDYNHPASADGFWALVGARDIDVHGAAAGIINGYAIPGALFGALVAVAREFAYGGVLFVAAGIAASWKRDRAQTVALLLVTCVGAAFAAAFSDESDKARYLLQTYVIAAFFFGIGFNVLRSAGAWARTLTGIAAFGLAAALLVQGRVLAGQPHDERARNEITEVMRYTPDNAIVVSTWVLAPPLAYAAYVERSAGHRTIVPAWYGDTADRLAQWTRTRPVYVTGTPEGSVDGFRLERLPSHTELYRVVHE